MAIRTATFVALGCRANQYDSANLARSLRARGIAPARVDADLIVIQSCAVTEGAFKDSLYAARKAKRLHPRAKVALAGCIPKEKVASLLQPGGVDFLLPNFEKEKWAERIDEMARETPRPPNIPLNGRRSRALLKIQDGCDSRCSFCIVPALRGGSQSRSWSEIEEEWNELLSQGFREIVLTGIHMGKYRDPKTGERFTELVERLVAGLTLGRRVRLSSLEPLEVTDALIDLMARDPRLCRHLHLPLQSASNRILGKMRRPYTRERYASLLQSIHSAVPEAAIGVDVIAGYPTETEREFEETIEFLRGLPFSYLHVFPFSARPGTAAEKEEGRVAPALIRERVRRLRALSDERAEAFAEAELNRALEDHVKREIVIERSPSGVSGYTSNYIRVQFETDRAPQPGSLVSVRIHRREGARLVATL